MEKNSLKDQSNEELLAQLAVTRFGGFPKDLLRELQSRGESVVPGLIEILQRESKLALDGSNPETHGGFFVFILLSAIGDPKALPAVIEAISLPEGVLSSLLGDLIHDELQRAIVKLIGTDFDQIEKLINNPDLYLYVRWSLSSCYRFLVLEGRMSREEAVLRLERHLESQMQHPTYELNSGLCIELADLGASSSVDLIRRAYESGNADESIVSLEELVQQIESADDDGVSRDNAFRPLEFDAVDELSQWATFQPTPAPKKIVAPPVPPKSSGFSTLDQQQAKTPPPLVGTVRNKQSAPGRNDPCPCGSGKKYKKCCRLKPADETRKGN